MDGGCGCWWRCASNPHACRLTALLVLVVVVVVSVVVGGGGGVVVLLVLIGAVVAVVAGGGVVGGGVVGGGGVAILQHQNAGMRCPCHQRDDDAHDGAHAILVGASGGVLVSMLVLVLVLVFGAGVCVFCAGTFAT